jgi:hypothetical protein
MGVLRTRMASAPRCLVKVVVVQAKRAANGLLRPAKIWPGAPALQVPTSHQRVLLSVVWPKYRRIQEWRDRYAEPSHFSLDKKEEGTVALADAMKPYQHKVQRSQMDGMMRGRVQEIPSTSLILASPTGTPGAV